jgi:hypothetical protein
LSKYITLESHFALLQSIHNDVPYTELIPSNDEGVLTTGRKRYFVERDGIVIRDKLIDLVHAEGRLTDQIRMVMYFVFLLRDERYRDFICTRVARENGEWSEDALHGPGSPVFTGAGGQKAFTNLRQLLVHTNLLTPKFNLRKFPDIETWFSDGVEIAAQHIADPLKRRTFLETPQSVIYKYKIHGILNITVEKLLSIENVVELDQENDMLPTYESPNGRVRLPSGVLKPWNPATPALGLKKPRISLTDPVLLERANGQHQLLGRMMAQCCEADGLKVAETEYIDLLVRDGKSIFFEFKSCTLQSIRSQTRRGVAQLLEYRYLYRGIFPNPLLCIVLERKPRGTTEWLIEYVESLDICLVWKDDLTGQFACSPPTRDVLAPLLPSVSMWQV